MNISKINAVSFGQASDRLRMPPEQFSRLPLNAKLDVIYDKLLDVRAHQEYSASVITQNQATMHRANEQAFQIMSDVSYKMPRKYELVTDTFQMHSVSQMMEAPKI